MNNNLAFSSASTNVKSSFYMQGFQQIIANHAPQMPRRSSDCAVVKNTYTNTTGLWKSFVSSAANQSPAVKQERRCFHCDSRMHLFKRCPHRDTTVVKSASSRVNDKQSSNNQSTPKLPNTASVSATMTDGHRCS